MALIASNVSSGRTQNGIVSFSAKVAVVSLIASVGWSAIATVAFMRGHEQAKSRHIDELRRRGEYRGGVDEGKYNRRELLFILVSCAFSLSCFFVGLLFLGRIAFHF